MQLDPLEREYKSTPRLEEFVERAAKSTKVVCPCCSNSIKSEDINIQDKVAKCNSCHEVFSFQHDLDSLLKASSKPNKPLVGRQKDIDISEYKGELNISVINFTDWAAIISLFSGFIGTIIGIAATVDFGFIGLPVLLTFVALLAFSIYRFISYRNNRMYIDVDDKYLYVKNRPKNFMKDKSYLISNIRQFYPKSYASAGYYGYYHLYMVYDGPEGEEHIKLTPYMRSRSRALYLEQELEGFLGIPDEVVPEEIEVPRVNNLNM